jgi:hypothetical protein
MHAIFVDPCLPLTLAPVPRCFRLRRRLYLGMMLGCFVLARVAIYVRPALGNALSCLGAKPCSISRASFWLPLTVMAPKVVGTLRQRYTECRAASKVFSRPRLNMPLYRYSMSTTSKIMSTPQRKLPVLQLSWARSFPAEAVERLCRFF